MIVTKHENCNFHPPTMTTVATFIVCDCYDSALLECRVWQGLVFCRCEHTPIISTEWSISVWPWRLLLRICLLQSPLSEQVRCETAPSRLDIALTPYPRPLSHPVCVCVCVCVCMHVCVCACVCVCVHAWGLCPVWSEREHMLTLFLFLSGDTQRYTSCILQTNATRKGCVPNRYPSGKYYTPTHSVYTHPLLAVDIEAKDKIYMHTLTWQRCI